MERATLARDLAAAARRAERAGQHAEAARLFAEALAVLAGRLPSTTREPSPMWGKAVERWRVVTDVGDAPERGAAGASPSGRVSK